MTKRAEVVAIGDELLHGAALDTNSQWLARRIEAIGLRVARFTVVGDHPDELTAALVEACGRTDLVLVTGGLGPTEDDRTRHAVAAAAGVELRFDPQSWRWMEGWFSARGRALGEENRRQALVPVGGEGLENRWGTAPGLDMRIGGARLFALPGVPPEMRAMFDAHVRPRLCAELGAALRPFAHASLRVIGPTEASLGERLADLMRHDGGVDGVDVGVTAHYGLLTVRVAAAGATVEDAEARVEAVASQIRPRLGDELVYEGEESLAVLVADALVDSGRTLVTAESCTGGLIAKLLTDRPGVSAAFPGGWVTYSNAAKQRDLGVPADVVARHGAVSEAVARAMATGARSRAGADLAVAVTGIAGPDGGDAQKPVGTVWFALAAGDSCDAWCRRIPPVNREFVRERSALEALAAVLRRLTGRSSPGRAARPTK